VDNNTTQPVPTPVRNVKNESQVIYASDQKWLDIWADIGEDDYTEPPIRKIPDNEFIPKWAAWAKNTKTKSKK
jgi:hypothetical protein